MVNQLKDNSDLKIFINHFIENLETEINFFKEHIKRDLEYISPYDRFTKDNEDYIEKNMNKQEEFFRFAYENYHSYFPYMVNNSLLITFDSYFDYTFLLLAELISKKTSINWKCEKSNGTYIYKCFKFFEDNFKIQPTEKDWVIVKDYHKIRNLVVHHNSCLIEEISEANSIQNIDKMKEHKNYRLISGNEHIDFNEISGKFYITDNKFLIEYLESIDRFIRLILAKILI